MLETLDYTIRIGSTPTFLYSVVQYIDLFIRLPPKVIISNQTHNKSHELGTKNTSMLFSDLKPQESYTVFVLAKTKWGYGSAVKKTVRTSQPAGKYIILIHNIF